MEKEVVKHESTAIVKYEPVFFNASEMKISEGDYLEDEEGTSIDHDPLGTESIDDIKSEVEDAYDESDAPGQETGGTDTDEIAFNNEQKYRRRPVSDGERELIIAANDNGESPKAIASKLGVKLCTVYHILREYCRHGKVKACRRGGRIKKKLHPGAIADVQKWIEEDCSVSLKTLATRVLACHGTPVSTSTIARLVLGFRFMFTRINSKTLENGSATALQLKNYTEQFNDVLARTGESRIVYISAADFDVCTRCSANVAKRRKMSIMCAMTRTAILLYTVYDRPLDAAKYEAFSKNLQSKLIDFNQSVIILNHGLTSLYSELRSVIPESCDILRLPPASNELNPVENLFSKLKNIILKADPKNVQALMSAVREGASLITEQDCDSFVRTMFSFLSSCNQET